MNFCIRSKESWLHSKELCIRSKEPVHTSSVRKMNLCIRSKESWLHSKELCIRSNEPVHKSSVRKMNLCIRSKKSWLHSKELCIRSKEPEKNTTVNTMIQGLAYIERGQIKKVLHWSMKKRNIIMYKKWRIMTFWKSHRYHMIFYKSTYELGDCHVGARSICVTLVLGVGVAVPVTCEWVTSHVDESCHVLMSRVIHQWVIPHVCSTHICGTGVGGRRCSACHMSTRHGKYRWVISHINESCHILMSHVTY